MNAENESLRQRRIKKELKKKKRKNLKRKRRERTKKEREPRIKVEYKLVNVVKGDMNAPF